MKSSVTVVDHVPLTAFPRDLEGSRSEGGRVWDCAVRTWTCELGKEGEAIFILTGSVGHSFTFWSRGFWKTFFCSLIRDQLLPVRTHIEFTTLNPKPYTSQELADSCFPSSRSAEVVALTFGDSNPTAALGFLKGIYKGSYYKGSRVYGLSGFEFGVEGF